MKKSKLFVVFAVLLFSFVVLSVGVESAFAAHSYLLNLSETNRTGWQTVSLVNGSYGTWINTAAGTNYAVSSEFYVKRAAGATGYLVSEIWNATANPNVMLCRSYNSWTIDSLSTTGQWVVFLFGHFDGIGVVADQLMPTGTVYNVIVKTYNFGSFTGSWSVGEQSGVGAYETSDPDGNSDWGSASPYALTMKFTIDNTASRSDFGDFGYPEATATPNPSATPVGTPSGDWTNAFGHLGLLVQLFVIFLLIFVPPLLVVAEAPHLGMAGYFVGMVLMVGIGLYVGIIPMWFLILIGMALVVIVYGMLQRS